MRSIIKKKINSACRERGMGRRASREFSTDCSNFVYDAAVSASSKVVATLALDGIYAGGRLIGGGACLITKGVVKGASAIKRSMKSHTDTTAEKKAAKKAAKKASSENSFGEEYDLGYEDYASTTSTKTVVTETVTTDNTETVGAAESGGKSTQSEKKQSNGGNQSKK